MWGIIGGCIFFLILAMCMCAGDANDPNAEHCVDWHRRNGGYQVRYPDGLYSQAFTYDVARDYRNIFGGTIVLKGHKNP